MNIPSSWVISMNIEHFTPPIVPAEQVPDLWKENDILIFIMDLKDYPSPDANYLNEAENVHLDTLQTEYFKKRYIVSRIVLKYLSGYLKKRSWSDMVTYKDEHGRVHVCSYDDLHVCIAYTENIIALALSKTDVGIDLEIIRARSFRSISKSIDRSLPDGTPSENSSDFILMWTLKEAYSKYSNETMFSNLSKKVDLSNIFHSNCIIDNKYMLAVVTKADQCKVGMYHLQKIDMNRHDHQMYQD